MTIILSLSIGCVVLQEAHDIGLEDREEYHTECNTNIALNVQTTAPQLVLETVIGFDSPRLHQKSQSRKETGISHFMLKPLHRNGLLHQLPPFLFLIYYNTTQEKSRKYHTKERYATQNITHFAGSPPHRPR